MSIEGLSQHWQLSVSFQAPERLLRLQQAGGGPSERHLGTAPALDVAADLADRPQRILDDVGASE